MSPCTVRPHLPNKRETMNLSQNFTLEELTVTSTGLVNKPDSTEIFKLTELALHLLQPIRDRWGALQITSGFRSWAVNSAVGGVNTSQHCFGEAADFITRHTQLDDVFEWIVKESGLSFGQCISENKGGRRWIHISLPRVGKTNQQALVYNGHEYLPYPEGA